MKTHQLKQRHDRRREKRLCGGYIYSLDDTQTTTHLKSRDMRGGKKRDNYGGAPYIKQFNENSPSKP